MTPAALFRRLGGFDPVYHLNYNDVDYCLRVQGAGRRVAWTPYVQVYHFESASKSGFGQDELDTFLAQWGRELARDPYYHPALTRDYCDYRLEA